VQYSSYEELNEEDTVGSISVHSNPSMP